MQPETPGQQLDQQLDSLSQEQERLRDSLRREKARSDLLWELAIRRGLVSLEDATMHEGAGGDGE
jgi:hypothetical protein